MYILKPVACCVLGLVLAGQALPTGKIERVFSLRGRGETDAENTEESAYFKGRDEDGTEESAYFKGRDEDGTEESAYFKGRDEDGTEESSYFKTKYLFFDAHLLSTYYVLCFEVI
ncbi:hypothetical protein HYFRA_00009460 [Hymenoscyphus fraxineus]|uniref:Uncharacterized protein n=1 Tax=Hymenoscyphus fraxineus TaxID=746836 RepID=A0A9N9KXW6_9HELO|nr:hypothetical protein HYFRA_00009460 [Hymenoscyphus fraxineus]